MTGDGLFKYDWHRNRLQGIGFKEIGTISIYKKKYRKCPALYQVEYGKTDRGTMADRESVIGVKQGKTSEESITISIGSASSRAKRPKKKKEERKESAESRKSLSEQKSRRGPDRQDSQASDDTLKSSQDIQSLCSARSLVDDSQEIVGKVEDLKDALRKEKHEKRQLKRQIKSLKENNSARFGELQEEKNSLSSQVDMAYFKFES